MSESPLIQAKEALTEVMEEHLSSIERLYTGDRLYDVNVTGLIGRFKSFQHRVWAVFEKRLKQSYQNGIADGSKLTVNRNLLDVTHHLCARITAAVETLGVHHDRRVADHVLEELAETLQRMPFTSEEGALVHRTLEPIVAKYGKRRHTEAGAPLNFSWMKPLLDALEKVPGKQSLTETSA